MSPGPSSRANAPKPAGEAALEPKALRRATELPVPQAVVGCAVSPAGRWRVTPNLQADRNLLGLATWPLRPLPKASLRLPCIRRVRGGARASEPFSRGLGVTSKTSSFRPPGFGPPASAGASRGLQWPPGGRRPSTSREPSGPKRADGLETARFLSRTT